MPLVTLLPHGEGRNRIVRPQGIVELLLPTLAAGDAVDKELLPRSICEQRRAMQRLAPASPVHTSSTSPCTSAELGYSTGS